ncbi:hypothetical protein [Rufibacter roseus]|nr:hypothetical protein [Rufibacter roseus]
MYQQQYHQYTIPQQQIWNILYTKRVEALVNQVAQPFWQGLQALELKAYFIPDFQELNTRLKRTLDWELVATEAPLRPAAVLARWSKHKFPAITTLRLHPDADLRLQGHQDLFSDVFSLLPWLFQPAVSDFMFRLGRLAQQNKSPEAIEVLWRLAQHVLGNGLLRDEEGKVTLMGANLLSNAPEAESALKKEDSWKPAVLEEMLAQPVKAGEAPEYYFVLESLSDLTSMVDQLGREGLPLVELPAEIQLIAG